MLAYPTHNMLLSVVFSGWQGQLQESSPVVAALYATDRSFADVIETAPLQAWRGYLSFSEYEAGAGEP